MGIPKSGVPATGLECNWCGVVNQPEVPKPAVAKTTAPTTAKPSTASSTKTAKPKAPPRKWADDDEDDGLPYDIPADEITTKPCEACQKEIGLDAVVCIHCGHDHRNKEKAERVYSPIDKTWEQGWPFARRMTVFLICQVLNVMTMGVGIFAVDQVAAATTATLVYVFLQAFILGTYPRLRIRRNKKGQAEITNTWRVCFIPIGTRKVDWRSHEGVSYGVYDGAGVLDWCMFVLMLEFLIIPGIIWWWYVIRSDRFFTALTLQNGALETYLYRGLREDQAKEITQTITDATGLKLNTPL